MITRYAPAPTGFLHIGHVVNAVHVWGWARSNPSALREPQGRPEQSRGATGSGQARKVLLRIEDHDRQRSRPAFEAAILEDLAWLGFRADGPMVRQSERGDIYSHALNALRAQGLVYACGCSRAEIATSGVGAELAPPGGADQGRPLHERELRYPGTCRDRGLTDGPGLGLRVRLEPSVETFVDLRHGPQEQRPSEQCGDLLVRDREGNWTYQFAATVDDMVQGVTHVIRGDDLLSSTGRQIQLARLLGRSEPPAFLHHSLIMKSPAQKLSKSDGDTGIRELREKGWTPDRVIEYAMACVRATLP